jgi:hypothetical protein
MSIVDVVEKVSAIVSSTIEESRHHAYGIGPEPDSERVSLQILHALMEALRSDPGLQRELALAMNRQITPEPVG